MLYKCKPDISLANKTGHLDKLPTIAHHAQSRPSLNDRMTLSVLRLEAFVSVLHTFELDPTFHVARLYLATAYVQQYMPGNETPENLKVCGYRSNYTNARRGAGAIWHKMAVFCKFTETMSNL